MSRMNSVIDFFLDTVDAEVEEDEAEFVGCMGESGEFIVLAKMLEERGVC